VQSRNLPRKTTSKYSFFTNPGGGYVERATGVVDITSHIPPVPTTPPPSRRSSSPLPPLLITTSGDRRLPRRGACTYRNHPKLSDVTLLMTIPPVASPHHRVPAASPQVLFMSVGDDSPNYPEILNLARSPPSSTIDNRRLPRRPCHCASAPHSCRPTRPFSPHMGRPR
jgi:hypothetical protein